MKETLDLLDAVRRGVPCVHVSMDDCILGLQESFAGQQASLFEADYFGYIKRLHDETGLALTNYLFMSNKGLVEAWLGYDKEKLKTFGHPGYFDLGMMNERFRTDFEGSRSWLRWNFHAQDHPSPTNTQTSHEVMMAFEVVWRAVHDRMGQELAQTWRPHFYVSDGDACNLMRENGTKVLFTPDDGRKSAANLRPLMVARMQGSGGLTPDPESKFLLLRSLFRVEESDLSDMESIATKHVETYGVAAFFGHEQALTKSSNADAEAVRTKFRKLLDYVQRRGWAFTV